MARAHDTSFVDTDLASPAMVLDEIGALRSSADHAEAMLLVKATEWADLHPATDPADAAWPSLPRLMDPYARVEAEFGHLGSHEVDLADGEQAYDVPAVLWSAIPEFAARLGMSTAAGQRMILEGLELRHRLPETWRQLRAGRVQVWRARRIAQATLGEAADVAAWIDRHVAPIAQRVGVVTLDRLIDEALLQLHPEERELRREEAREQRHVGVHTDGSADGLAYIDITTDTLDALEFDVAVAAIARRLGDLGDTDTLDVRRAKAIGILADPEAAMALLADTPEPAAGADAKAPARRPRKQIVLHVHVSEAAITGSDPVGHLETGNISVLTETIREWAGRGDVRLTVQPVIDLNQTASTRAYQVPDRMKRQVELTAPTCAHPWCNRPAAGCDKDHVVPYDSGGETSTANLAPLCRRHHRLKTLTAWTYEILAPATYLWTSPLGRRYLKDNSGTTDVT